MIATAVLAAEYAGTLEAADTTTVRVRATYQTLPAAAPPAPAAPGMPAPVQQPAAPPNPVMGGVDASTLASATVRASNRRWVYTLSYSPSLTLPDLEQGVQPEVFHFGSASIAWHGRYTTLSLTEAAAYGQFNSATSQSLQSLSGQTTVLQPLPAAQTINFGLSTTDATLAERVGTRVLLSLSGGYGLSGGLDSESRKLLSEQYGPRASASLDYTASRLDDFTTRATVQETQTTGQCPQTLATCHERVDDVEADETFRRRVSPTTMLSLRAGLALYDTLVPGAQATVIYPLGLATLSYRFGPHGTSAIDLVAGLTPGVDVRTGLASDWAIESATLTDRLTSTVTLHVGVSALETVFTSDVPGANRYAANILTGSIDAIFRLNRQVDLSLGEQGLWQDQGAYGTLVSVFTYAAVTVRAPATRL